MSCKTLLKCNTKHTENRNMKGNAKCSKNRIMNDNEKRKENAIKTAPKIALVNETSVVPQG